MTDKEIDERIISGLSVSQEDGVWTSVHLLLNRAAEHEMQSVLQPGLSDADRHFNAGRLAAIADFEHRLANWWKMAHQTQPKDPTGGRKP